jgi:NAD+ synthetase
LFSRRGGPFLLTLTRFALGNTIFPSKGASVKIALCQANPTVGDLAANSELIAAMAARAAGMGADVALFGELALVGYPPRDLLLKNAFLTDAARAIETLASRISGITAVVGTVTPAEGDGRLHNSAVVISSGRVSAVAHKRLLPTYDVFDEERYFAPGTETLVVEVAGKKAALTICEDAWNDADFWNGRPAWWGKKTYSADPLADAVAAGAQVVLNLSASPFQSGKGGLRAEMLAFSARKHGIPMALVNQVGGNDELVFDGASFGVSADGELTAPAKSFDEDIVIFDTDAPRSIERPTAPVADEVFDALVLGTRDYVHKCGFKSGIVGLSGGIDSSLVAAVAAEALGAENVIGCLMPSMYSSAGSLTDAEALAANLGIETVTIPIADIYGAFTSALSESFAGTSTGLAEENIQARIRGTILMALSNKLGGIVLSTGNKSEVSVGYCTLYGDMAGGLDVIGDVPKTLVWEIARRLNRDREVIPPQCITKPPSAELRPDQLDEDSLPPYELLDRVLKLYVEEEKGASEIIAAGFDAATVERVVRLVDTSEYKRKQAAPVLKVTGRAFGFGRRMPIAQRYRQSF